MTKKRISAWVLLVCITLLAVACGPANNQTTPGTGTEQGSTGENRISIATGGSGGTFYTLGAGMADIMNNRSSTIQAVSETTAATGENLKLVQQGEAEVAFSVYDALVDAYNGNAPYETHDNLRLIMRGHTGIVHVYTAANSGIATIEDFKGKRISMAPGDIGIALLENTLNAAGLTMNDVTGEPMSMTDTNTGLQDKTVDVGFQTMGIPGSSIMEITNIMDINFISIPDDQMKTILAAKPAWSYGKIPAGTYKNQDAEINALEIPYCIYTSKDVSDEVVYDFLKTLLENTDLLEKIHVEGKWYSKDNPLFEQDALVPYHPGAEKYLKEQGIIK